MSDDTFHRLLSRAAPSLLSLLEAHNREIELATARKVLEAVQSALKRDTYVYAVGVVTDAVLALYPELGRAVEPRAAAHAGVSGLHFAQPGDFTQLHRNEPVEPGKEPAQ